MPTHDVLIWTDGSVARVETLATHMAPGELLPGGWAALLVTAESSTEYAVSGHELYTSSQTMELRAVVEALDLLAGTSGLRIRVTTDLQVIHFAMTGRMAEWQRRGWRNSKGAPLRDVDLWKRIADHDYRHRITWCWVPSHAGEPMNERVDRLAGVERAAAVAKRLAGGRETTVVSPETETIAGTPVRRET